MNAVICDRCKDIIEGGINHIKFDHEAPHGAVSITLDSEKDWCWACGRKEGAKLAQAIWEGLKQKRQPKVKEEK